MHTIKGAGGFAGKLESAEQKAREENLDGESFFRTFGPLVRRQLAQGVSKQEILQAFKERPDLCTKLRNAGYVSEVNEQPELREILRQVNQA